MSTKFVVYFSCLVAFNNRYIMEKCKKLEIMNYAVVCETSIFIEKMLLSHIHYLDVLSYKKFIDSRIRNEELWFKYTHYNSLASFLELYLQFYYCLQIYHQFLNFISFFLKTQLKTRFPCVCSNREKEREIMKKSEREYTAFHQ
jgi:hypothetical protein